MTENRIHLEYNILHAWLQLPIENQSHIARLLSHLLFLFERLLIGEIRSGSVCGRTVP